jgi:hypothetical protein
MTDALMSVDFRGTVRKRNHFDQIRYLTQYLI